MMMATRSVRSKRSVTRLFALVMHGLVYRYGRVVDSKPFVRFGRRVDYVAYVERYSPMISSLTDDKIRPSLEHDGLMLETFTIKEGNIDF